MSHFLAFTQERVFFVEGSRLCYRIENYG